MKILKEYIKTIYYFLRIPFSISNRTKQRIQKKMQIILNDAELPF